MYKGKNLFTNRLQFSCWRSRKSSKKIKEKHLSFTLPAKGVITIKQRYRQFTTLTHGDTGQKYGKTYP